MRQVFSSPRLENVERVAALLRAAGIETRISHPRSYKGGLRGAFSYRDHVRTEPVPAVWVIKSEDQPAARVLLRDAGLLGSTRAETGYTLPAFRSEEPLAPNDPARKRAFRLKVGLLLAIASVVVLAFLSLYKPPVATLDPALPAGVSLTPDALAVAALAGELPTRTGQAICLSLDGRDPSTALLAALPPSPGRVVPASTCALHPELPMLSIGNYRTTASGTGTLNVERRAGGGTSVPVSRTYDVRRDGAGWRVIEPY